MTEPVPAQTPDAAPPSLAAEGPRLGLFWRELPYLIVLVMTLIGVAYTSAARRPLVLYWEVLALTVAAVCIFSGWRHTEGRDARLRLLWTQVLHWGAFLAAMNIVLLPGVQRVLTASSTGLTLLMLLALGTFVAGIHLSLRICLLGLTMALFVPAIAWLKQSAVFLLLATIAVVGIGLAVWWIRASSRPPVGRPAVARTAP
jgi:hypothetical protein